MGLFRRKTKSDKIEGKSFLEDCNEIDKSSWKSVFSACLGKMMAVQNACNELVVKGQDWNVDFSRGIISFGTDEYPLQFLGSEASSDNTWLWGWDNINGFSEDIIEVAEETRKFGEKWGLEPLTVPQFQLNDTFQGHNLSIVACGISSRKLCYYRGPHSGGAVFVAFSGVPEEVFSPVDVTKFINLTMQSIQNFSVDHKRFVESFLAWNGITYEWENEQRIAAHFESELQINFEHVGEIWRIQSMNSRI